MGIVVAHIHTPEVSNLAQLMATTVATVEEQIIFPDSADPRTRAKLEATGCYNQKTREVKAETNASIHVMSINWNTGQNPRQNLNQVMTTTTYL